MRQCVTAKYASPKGETRLAQGVSPGLSGKKRTSPVGTAEILAGMRGSNSVVESQPSKLLVAGSIPVSRSRSLVAWCAVEG